MTYYSLQEESGKCRVNLGPMLEALPATSAVRMITASTLRLMYFAVLGWSKTRIGALRGNTLQTAVPDLLLRHIRGSTRVGCRRYRDASYGAERAAEEPRSRGSTTCKVPFRTESDESTANEGEGVKNELQSNEWMGKSVRVIKTEPKERRCY
ncbi:hypothetical protein C8Q80DRAFT_1122095 [Daedaleopsis nitida]|nr:hypothetical protein C8Q80DRAFT_1122095 [Daedaleopsis nitida]